MRARWYESPTSLPRYKELIALRAEGLTQQGIAERWGVIRPTVQEMLTNIPRDLSFKQAVALLADNDPSLRMNQLGVLADLSLSAIQASGLPLLEQVKRFEAVINDLAAEVAKLPEGTKAAKKQHSPAQPYIDDLTGRKSGRESTRRKELRANPHPVARYLEDIEERYG